MKRRNLLAGLLVVGVVAAVVFYISSQSGEKMPRLTIYLDKDKCRRCGMVISRQEYAAGLLVKGIDDWWKYDDIGCMLKHYLENVSKAVFLAVAVYDYNTKEQLDGKSAYYVKADPEKLWTPMNSGIVAVKEADSAGQLAHKYQGHVYGWEEILREVEMVATHHA